LAWNEARARSGAARRAVIVGGGIGGLTAALELRRAGFEVTVYERRPQLAEVDTGFVLWSFAIKRLRALGLGEGLEEIGEPLRRLIHKSRHGEMLSEISLEALSQRIGAPSYDVHRARLQELLADALGRDAIRLGEGCTGVVDGGRPAALLEGGESAQGDLLVGADGVNSAVRRHVAGDVSLRRDDVAIWRGVAELGTDVIRAGDHIRLMGPGALFGVGRLDERTVRWYAGALGLAAGEPGSVEEVQDRARARFAGWAEPAGTVIAATKRDAFLYNDAPRAWPLAEWSRGPVVLLGDAAHPTLPTLATGGGMAIEDAAVLGDCVRRQPDLLLALRAYERRRRPRASATQILSLAFAGILGIRRPRAVRLRDAALAPPFDRAQRVAVGRLMRGP
jgi:FAD-dependent urate hydroxylase